MMVGGGGESSAVSYEAAGQGTRERVRRRCGLQSGGRAQYAEALKVRCPEP